MTVPADPAATVMLLREGPTSPEVLLVERHAKSGFLPSMYVFPGGRVDDGDREMVDRVDELTEATAAERLPTVPAHLALAFFVAGIRETFEESGILLARRRGERDLVPPTLVGELSSQRLDIQSHRASFRELVETHDLLLATDLLAVHAHWITPHGIPKRFDTIFFSTIAPEGQLAEHDGVESTDHVWLRPEDAIDQARAGKRRMIFPTSCNLRTLSGFDDCTRALEASRERPVVPVLPDVIERDGKRRLLIPEAAGYGDVDDLLFREDDVRPP